MSVDIIVPIYNAYEDLQICLQSIYENTDLQSNRLVLINDNSPDERVAPFLDEQKNKTDGQIIVIHNKENKGFSNNINLGMKQSDANDVILLNSDTIVTKNWVEKMVACAYSDGSIGTVTPLSNNATLCSVPNFCEENELPKGMSVERVAEIVEECSMKKYPRITVAHGFCMLVKREVIKCIGYFDAETFGRGYGEENDFCNRAEQMGYIHVMCDDTYIYHSGTKSFVSKEKENYIREHDKILHERYPAQMHNNAVHCQNNPNAFVGDNIRYHLDIRNGRKNVLYLLQSDFREGADDNIGGTQLHVKHLVMGLRNEMNIFVAARDREYLQVTAYVGEKEHVFRFYIGEKEAFPVFRSRKLAEIFRLILEGFYIDLVHVHHTSTTSLDIYYEAEKLGIPIIYTAHDFYYVCPTIRMLDKNGEVCIERTVPDCAACLRSKIGLCERNDFLQQWRKQHEKILCICRLIVVPSESTRGILGLYYPEQKEKIRVIEHGMDKAEILSLDENEIIDTRDLYWEIDKREYIGNCLLLSGTVDFKDEIDIQRRVILRIEDKNGHTVYMPTNYDKNMELFQGKNRFYCYLPNHMLSDGDMIVEAIVEINDVFYINKDSKIKINRVNCQDSEGFNVAFIGGINEEKGASAIYDIIKKGPDDVEWYIMGGIGDVKLYQLKKNNLVKSGFYYQEDLSTHLKYHKIDVICILSTWPETFSYTLSEAIINDIPVIVTDVGALGQRVRKDNLGCVVKLDKEGTVIEVINIVNAWKRKEEKYQEVCENLKKYSHLTLCQMIEQYQKLYFMNIKEKSDITCINKEDNERLYSAYMMILGGAQGEMQLIDTINGLENRLSLINRSMAFRIAMKLTGIRIPFKKEIRALFVKLFK